MWIVVSPNSRSACRISPRRAIVNLNTQSAIERNRCVIVTRDEIDEVELRALCHGCQFAASTLSRPGHLIACSAAPRSSSDRQMCIKQRSSPPADRCDARSFRRRVSRSRRSLGPVESDRSRAVQASTSRRFHGSRSRPRRPVERGVQDGEPARNTSRNDPNSRCSLRAIRTAS